MQSLRGRDWLPWLQILLATFVWPATLTASGSAVAADLPSLTPGAPQQREIAAGQAHAFRLELASGQRVLIQVEQKGVDVSLHLLDPSGRSLADIDSPLYRFGPESLLVQPDSPPGSYRLEVRATSTAGAYEIRGEALPDATPEDRQLLAAHRLLTLASDLSREQSAESRREALGRCREAAPLFGKLGRKREQASALQCAGNLFHELGEAREAAVHYGQAAALWAEAGALPHQANSLTVRGVALLQSGQAAEALADFEQALALQRGLGDRLGEAAVLSNICLFRQSRGEHALALSCFEEARERFREAGQAEFESVAESNLGSLYQILGEPRKALAAHQRALALLPDQDLNRGARARTLSNLAVLYESVGEMGEALSYYDRALTTVRQLGDRAWEARILNNTGVVYMKLGEADRARNQYELALGLRRELGDRRGEASTRINLATLAMRESPKEALAQARQALEIARAAEDRRGEANALSLLGWVQTGLRDFAAGSETLRKAAEIFAGLGDRGGQGRALLNLGRLYNAQGDSGRAAAALQESLALQREVGDVASEAEVLVGLARTARRLGHLTESQARVEEALARIEGLRTTVANPDLRASFVASRRDAYELQIDLLMELDRRDPAGASGSGGSHARAALEASERGRTRALLDLLREAGADIREGVDPALRERERSLLERLNAKAARRMAPPATASAASVSPEQRAAVDRDIQALLAELDTVQAGIRKSSPRYAALTQPQPLRLADIQKLLGPDTLLLEYALGEERSYLWAVDAAAVTSFELPPRGRIEAAARQVYDDLRTRTADPEAARQEAERAATLSAMILGPVAGRLGDRRLVIVADGALHYIPFAALPLPAMPGKSAGKAEGGTAAAGPALLTRHEVVSLPSASVLAEQRREAKPRPASPVSASRIAILADPVFDAQDPRVATAAGTAAGIPPKLAQAAPEPSPLRGGEPEAARAAAALSRLPATRREAEAIAALAPAGQIWTALDFQASRQAVLGGALAPYRLVHFATHGLIDSRTPELSGLALSLVDEKGQPTAGFLSLGDIYNLDLGADLVVLSGCETALGQEIRGEGLVGLTQGFLYAGARRVVASLWRVEDRATAELMGRLYRGLLQDGLRPAAALRQAQLAIAAERRWRDPYFWAPFVLQGDWD